MTEPCCSWVEWEPWLPEYPTPHQCAESLRREQEQASNTDTITTNDG